jgi:hypothetical protein
MGNVNFGVDMQRTLALRDKYKLAIFVETGTFKGQTALWAAAGFDWVYTLENDTQRYVKTFAALKDVKPRNLALLRGDSRVELARLLATINQPCLIWLDAHWCGGSAEAAHEIGDECPLCEELQAINDSVFGDKHVVMIDDARLFTAPPPYPHDPAQWPTYSEIERLLAPRTVAIENDVIYAEPPS